MWLNLYCRARHPGLANTAMCQKRGDGGCQWPPGGPRPPVGRNDRSRAPKPMASSNLRTADAIRHEMRFESSLQTALALSNPVPNVLDELTHVLGHVEVRTGYHTNSEL
jgi:hypothetical protein